MEKGFYLSGISKEELLHEIKETVKQGTREEFERLSNDKLLTQEEASEFLKVSKTTLIDWSKKGKIIATKIVGRVFYKQSDLLNLKR